MKKMLRYVITSLILLWVLGCQQLENGVESSSAFSYYIDIYEDEKWWPGVISDSHRFPLGSDDSYEFDFYGNTAGNQGQPLLISNKGRYIWNEDPFSFRFEGNKIFFSCNTSDFEFGHEGNSLRNAYMHVANKFVPPSGKIPGKELFTAAQFNTWIEFTYFQNQKGILEYARGIVDNGFKPGVLMIDEGWANRYGDWEFDQVKFPDPKSMMKELKDLGFIVMLWVCPYFSPDGLHWVEQRRKMREEGDTIWIMDAENTNAPALLRWWNGSSNVIDLSNSKGVKWFSKQLNYLIAEYGVDGFKFDGGDAYHYSSHGFLTRAKSFKPNITPNEHSELWVKLGLEYPYNEYRAAWKMGGQPLAMRLRDKSHRWEDLNQLIPGIINQGLMGYPFACPDLIGGGEYGSFLNLSTIDQELIVRASQCHALMPMMQFSVAPWRVLTMGNLQICVEMAELHEGMSDLILQLAKEAARTGDPIVRSMDYVFPDNGYGLITDQFMLGNDIMVSPVLEQGAETRSVVIPSGTWMDDIGNTIIGPARLTIKAPLERLPWYKRI